jgi:lipopolysaccharide export system protein LptC
MIQPHSPVSPLTPMSRLAADGGPAPGGPGDGSRPDPAQPNKPRLSVRQLLHTLTLYIPVLLMALLALGTWWLASNTPKSGSDQPEVAAPPKHEPDYFMRNFSVRNFDAQGQLATQLSGKEMRHYPDTETFEIDIAQMRSTREGRVTTGSSNRAYSNADGSEVQLVGNAVVIREAGRDGQGNVWPRMEFRGEFLHVYTRTERVKSHKPVVILRGADRFEADTLAYDNLERVADLVGRARVTLVPQPAP